MQKLRDERASLNVTMERKPEERTYTNFRRRDQIDARMLQIREAMINARREESR